MIMGYPLQKDAEKLYRRLARLNSNDNSNKRFGRDGFLGLFGRKVDLLDHYGKRLEDLQDNVRMEQSLLAGKVCTIFVSFYGYYYDLVIISIMETVSHIFQGVVLLVTLHENSLVININVMIYGKHVGNIRTSWSLYCTFHIRGCLCYAGLDKRNFFGGFMKQLYEWMLGRAYFWRWEWGKWRWSILLQKNNYEGLIFLQSISALMLAKGISCTYSI